MASERAVRTSNKGLTCSVDGCGQPRRKRTWCAAHYAQWYTKGKSADPVPFTRKWATEKRCLVCGSTDVEKGRRRYCSDACQQMWHRTKGARPESTPCVICNAPIDLLTDLTRAGQRRRLDTKLCARCRQDKRKHGYSVQALAQRDGTDCGICRQPVDMSLRHPEPMRASVDHIVPRARGGANDPSNLQLAHLWCNQVKSDRVTAAEPLSPGPRSGERTVM